MPTTIPTTTYITRPGSPSAGDAYFETDTKNYIIYDGAAWRVFYNDGTQGAANLFSGLFDGTDDWIGIGDVSILNSATNFTISVWFKQTQSLTAGMLLGGTGSSGIGMYPFTDGKFYVHAGSVNTLNTTLPVTDDFINAVVTRDASNTKLYFNGSLAATATSKTIPSTAGDSFRIGTYTAYASSQPMFEGYIDEVAIWGETLDANNISAIYNTGNPIDISVNLGSYNLSSTLTHWYKFGDHGSDTGSGGVAVGNVITNIENAANPGTNDGSTINGTPSFSTAVPA